MLYFKHSELVNNYHVSLKTVHNWIDAAKKGKLDLGLYAKGNRTYIANTPANVAHIKRLAAQGKKYRNTRHHRVVTPKQEFYELYTRRQILDIISNLKIHHEIPRQYNYMDGGATNWDSMMKRFEKEEGSNLLRSTLELLQSNFESIDLLLKDHKKVNVIDVGVGNARPSKELLKHLLERGVLHRYIAIDISSAMLDIAEANIQSWFGDKIRFERHIRDITYERFDDLLVDDMLAKDADQTVNLVLLLGATPVNFRRFSDALQIAYGSMGVGDILIYTCRPDNEASRRYFDFYANKGDAGLSPNHRFILDLLNVDASLYDVEMGFDERISMRYIHIRLKNALTIQFKSKNIERGVELEKGDTILMLRIWHMSLLELIAEFEKNGFVLLQTNMSRDKERLMTISGVDAKSASGSKAR
jgi:SAM-dependent methyltransferase